MRPYRSKVQGQPSIDAQKDYQHGLDGMNDEDEIQCLLVGHAIEYQHRLHRKVPRPRTVGSRHDDSY